jgi:hypothetical protein
LSSVAVPSGDVPARREAPKAGELVALEDF